LGVPTPCVTPEDLTTISATALEEFDRWVATIPEDGCVEFNRAASSLEVELRQSYRFIASIARRTDDLDQISKLWSGMVEACDFYLARLHGLHEKHPICGAGYYYDRVLEIRNKCQRLAEIHR
jgi:hypothetical protein